MGTFEKFFLGITLVAILGLLILSPKNGTSFINNISALINNGLKAAMEK